jgi:phosphonate transport system ATP-binding protein
MLRVRRLSLRYPNGKIALTDFDLVAAPGELVVVLGGNGSGKTTLLRCITRTLMPSAGEIWLDDVDLAALQGERLRRARLELAMVSQHASLVGRRSVLRNVATGSLGRHFTLWTALGGLPQAELDAACRHLGEVGLAALAGQRAGTLSGGQQQRGAIARALVQQASLILADEPVASLDPVAARKVMEILKALNADDGLTVLVTLHQVDYALRYCRRAVALKAGKVVYDGPTQGLDRATLIDIYGPEFEDAFWEGATA